MSRHGSLLTNPNGVAVLSFSLGRSGIAARLGADRPLKGCQGWAFRPVQLQWDAMPDIPDLNRGMLELLIELAILQRTLKPHQGIVDQLIADRVPILQALVKGGVNPKLIHELTGVPLSTIYTIGGRPIGSRGRGRGRG